LQSKSRVLIERTTRSRNVELTEEYKRITEQYKELQSKFHHFQERDNKKYMEIFKLNQERVIHFADRLLKVFIYIAQGFSIFLYFSTGGSSYRGTANGIRMGSSI
jgi:hypothetical protein